VSSSGNDTIVFHAGIHALGYVELTLTFGAGVRIDGVDSLERFDGFGGTYRFTITTGGTDISNDG
jgi:hypothetical protein